MGEQKLILHVRQLEDFRNSRTIVRPLEIIEIGGIKCFQEYEVSRPLESRSLPNDFAIQDFLDLSADDEEELLNFQEQFGRIESVFSCGDSKELKRFHRYYVTNHQSKFGTSYENELIDEYDAIEQTQRARKTYIDQEARFNDLPPEQVFDAAQRIVSIDEATAVVKNLQEAIIILIETANSGLVPANNPRGRIANQFAVEYISRYIDECFGIIRLVSQEVVERYAIDAPLASLIAADFVYTIQDGEAGQEIIKSCEHCHKYFHFGRADSSPDGQFESRRRHSRYCSKECQRRANKHKRGKDGKFIY